MSEKKIGVSADARDVVRSLRTFDAGAPGPSEMSETRGVENEFVLGYVSSLQTMGRAMGQLFEARLREIQADCETSADVIDAMMALEDDIASLLAGTESTINDSPSADPIFMPSQNGPGDPAKTTW